MEENKNLNGGYDDSQIQVLEGLEAVRKRPGMYIGSVSTKGLNHLIYEIVDNSVDEHLAGFCDKIYVTLEADGSCTVSDNGRGIPVEMHVYPIGGHGLGLANDLCGNTIVEYVQRWSEDLERWLRLIGWINK